MLAPLLFLPRLAGFGAASSPLVLAVATLFPAVPGAALLLLLSGGHEALLLLGRR
jgi:hypothetical protein